MKIVNFVKEESYKGPIKIFITQKVKVKNNQSGILCNGVELNKDFFDDINLKEINKENIKHMFVWNYPTDELIVTTTLMGNKSLILDEEKLKFIGSSISKSWEEKANPYYSENPVLEVEGEKFFVEIINDADSLLLSTHPIDLPSGKVWLGSLFDAPEKQAMYEEFCENDVVLNILCKKYNIKPNENTTITDIPCHAKDTSTGEIIISEYLAKFFYRFCLAQNYLAAAEDEVSTEILVGKLAIVDPVFGDYLLFISERGTVNDENFYDQINKSYNKVKKDGFLSALFEEIN